MYLFYRIIHHSAASGIFSSLEQALICRVDLLKLKGRLNIKEVAIADLSFADEQNQ